MVLCGGLSFISIFFLYFLVFSYSCHVGAVNESRGLYPASKDHIVGCPRMDCIHWRSCREPRVGSCWRILKHFPVRIYCTFPNLPWDDYPSGSTSSPAMAMVWARQEKSFYSVKTSDLFADTGPIPINTFASFDVRKEKSGWTIINNRH